MNLFDPIISVDERKGLVKGDVRRKVVNDPSRLYNQTRSETPLQDLHEQQEARTLPSSSLSPSGASVPSSLTRLGSLTFHQKVPLNVLDPPFFHTLLQ